MSDVWCWSSNHLCAAFELQVEHCRVETNGRGREARKGNERGRLEIHLSCFFFVLVVLGPLGHNRHFQAAELERLQNWQHYLDLDDRAVIYNDEVFECSICFNEAQPGEGVKLRDCLHVFCCDCLRHAIVHCEDAEVICPYRDDQYSCQSVLQEREIRALVSLDVLEKLLQRSMARAESQAKNSFHCKTPDCQGWCLFEDNANEFSCPVCLHLNCITCRAIHEGMNCRQYQDKLMILARTDEEAKKTTDAIEVSGPLAPSAESCIWSL